MQLKTFKRSGAVALVAASAGIASLAGFGGGEPAAEPEVDLAAHFAILREAPSQLAPHIAEGMRRVSDRITTMDPSGRPLDEAVWQVRSPESGQSLYVLANEDKICLVAWEPMRGYSCTSARAATNPATPMTSTEPTARGTEIVALVPDQIRDVQVEGGGRSTRLRVANNVASGELPGAASVMRWTDGRGNAHMRNLRASPDKG